MKGNWKYKVDLNRWKYICIVYTPTIYRHNIYIYDRYNDIRTYYIYMGGYILTQPDL